MGGCISLQNVKFLEIKNSHFENMDQKYENSAINSGGTFYMHQV